MITLTFNSNNISAYIFDDAHDLVSTDTEITCPHFIIADMNSTNSTIHADVTPPEDWQGGKYFFESGAWTPDPDWIDPRLMEIAEREA
jgi:hypothetical protein